MRNIPQAACYVEAAVPAHSRAQLPCIPKGIVSTPVTGHTYHTRPSPLQYSLLGLGWLLWLLRVEDDEVNG